MAWLDTIPRSRADGALADVYSSMADRPMPEVYRPPHGDVAGIILVHSLDPQLMRLTFGASGTLHASSLGWTERELLSTITSRTNQCFY